VLLIGIGLFSCRPDSEVDDADSGVGVETSVANAMTETGATPSDLAIYEEGPELVCATPTEGIARLVEVTDDWGMTVAGSGSTLDTPCFQVEGGLVVRDLDGDGDIDVLVHRLGDAPVLLNNDGAGRFTSSVLAVNTEQASGRALLSVAGVDHDGDGLPELSWSGEDIALLSDNLGDMSFGTAEAIHLVEEYPRGCRNTHSWGDADMDGDLDLLLPGLDLVPDAEWKYSDFMKIDDISAIHQPAAPDLVLQREGDRFKVKDTWQVGADGEAGMSYLAVWTDRDADGDPDMLVTSDRPAHQPPWAFYRNDGLDSSGWPSWTNDAHEVGAPLRVASMGLAVQDLNDDGRVDYCTSDYGPRLACLTSGPDDTWFEFGAALGLHNSIDGHPNIGQRDIDVASRMWTTWSIALEDLDTDGWVDMLAVAGKLPDSLNAHNFHPDALWQGQPDGTFVAKHAETGFWSDEDHFGMVTADLEGDGFPDVLVHGSEGLRVWSNPCGDGAWITIDPVGPSANRDALGARVEVVAGGRHHITEVQGLRSLAQGPPEARFGLGDVDRIDDVFVRFPDGAEVHTGPVGLRRRVKVFHPAAQRTTAVP
jgi:hypothetical protein